MVLSVNGDPVKGGFQVHHLFAVQLYCAANRLMLWVMCSDGSFNNITNQNALDNDSLLRRIRSIIETYRTMRESWEVSAHEPV